MSYRIIIPFRAAGTRKTRLAARLGPAARDALALAMLARVAAAARQVAPVALLSPERPATDAIWLPDLGGGLNEELSRVRGHRAIAVIHADLPLATPEEIRALLSAAEQAGLAVAPDRHEIGTNALAVGAGVALDFCFGAGSLAGFLDQRSMIVRRPGLALDIDTPADLDAAIAAGVTLS